VARNQEIISFQLDELVELDEPDFRSDWNPPKNFIS